MKIFLDIGHPAHVHYFRNFLAEMELRGHEFLVTARNKEMTHRLLKAFDIPYVDRGKGSDSALGKLLHMVKMDAFMLPLAIKFKPDVFLSFGSPYAAHTAFLTGKPHIAFDDTENALLGQMFYRPFTKSIHSPDSFKPSFGSKHVKFPGFMELSHLHPSRFTPSTDKVRSAGIDPDGRYSIVRFVSWNANHDHGHSGMTLANKIRVVEQLSAFGPVHVTSEAPLPPEIESNRVTFAPELIHDVLAFASLCFGESATMASEAAVLGTPSIYLDDAGRGYTTELEEKYGLVSNFTESKEDQERAIRKAHQIMSAYDAELYARRRNTMLDEKIDVTVYMIDVVEAFASSGPGVR